MFYRIYGLILSVLIFSDIIQYIYKLTGGLCNLMCYIYLLLYIFNVMYTVYYHFFINKNNVNWFIFMKNTIIYKTFDDYVKLLKVIEIGAVYESRVKVSIIAVYINKGLNKVDNLMLFSSHLEKIPEQWCFWIKNNSIKYENLRYISYNESELISIVVNSKIKNMLDKVNLNNKLKYFIKYNNIYTIAIDCLQDLFTMFESVLFYKYYVYEKGAPDYDINNIKYKISSEEYDYVYKMYYLILKNILFYIWSFEFSVFQDKNNLTKIYIIDDKNLEYGYHVYPYDKNHFNTQDLFPFLVSEKDYILLKSQLHFNYKMQECLYILCSLISLTSSKSVNVTHVKNTDLKNVISFYFKYFEKFSIHTIHDNDVSRLKNEKAIQYFNELQGIINSIYGEWEIEYMPNSNIFDKFDDAYIELIKCAKENVFH